MYRSLTCVLIAIGAQSALADDGLLITAGLRLWSNAWTSWDVYPPLQTPLGSIPGAAENFTAGSRVTAIPTISARFGDLLLSASQFSPTRYTFEGNAGAFTARRDEADVLAGYYLLPTLAATLGYKQVRQDFGANAKFRYSGPTLGAVASAPLTAGFTLYGSFGLGRMRTQLPLRDAEGRSTFDANYLLGELGLAYSLSPGKLWPQAKAVALTAGYRSQVLSTSGFRIALDTSNASASRGTKLRDTTEGLTLGLSLSF
ncbi:MAG: hypothetical protein IPP44_08770 [Ideonella sp.]|nr:hypothetical protein [Ideonella sp.]